MGFAVAQPLLHEYRGTGKIHSEQGFTVNCEFVLRQSLSGELTLSCTTSDPSARKLFKESHSKRPLWCRFHGSSSHPAARVVAGQMYLGKHSFKIERGCPETHGLELGTVEPVKIEYQHVTSTQRVQYEIGLSNLVFTGTQLIRRREESYPGRIDLRIAEQDISLESLEWHNDLVKSLDDIPGINVTSHLVTTNQLSNADLVRQICDDLCVLLSFATCNWITPLYEDCFLNGHQVITTLLPYSTFRYNHGELVIDARKGNELKEYLETTYPNHVRLKNLLGMNIVMGYFVHARLTEMPEIKYLIAVTGMECLKSYLRDYFAAKGKTVNLNGFRTSLEEFFSDISMPFQSSELDFICIRNKIVHKGRFPPDIDRIEEYQKLLNLCDRTVLTTLGYRGKPYLDCAKGYARELVP